MADLRSVDLIIADVQEGARKNERNLTVQYLMVVYRTYGS